MTTKAEHLVFSHPDFEHELLEECARFGGSLDGIAKGIFSIDPVVRAQHKTSLVWARDEWPNAEIIEIESVSKAAVALRARSKLPWTQVTSSSHRRGELIEQNFRSESKIAKARAKKLGWPDTLPGEEGRLRVNPAFTLFSDSRMALCSAPQEEVPGGDWLFEEDREGPPSRAYLKLWEWAWRTSRLPRAGQTALDLGASPGGWTWVLAKNGLKVHAFDRSPLELNVSKNISSRIHFEKGDAFAMTPAIAPACDWVFCDVIAEPKRTVELIEAWLPSSAGLVFTVKFKGATDFGVIEHLAKVPGGSIRHLNVNKHEVTFWRTI